MRSSAIEQILLNALGDRKIPFGNLEADLIVVNQHQGTLLTRVDQKEKYPEIRLLVEKHSADVNASIIEALEPQKDPLQPITFDNGKAFMRQEKISEALELSCYFA